MEKIQQGKFVQLSYEIFVLNGQDETSVFQFTREQPDTFVFGLDPGMLPTFMQGIQGLAQDEKFDFTLPPEQAFGPRDPQMVIEVPRDKFFVEGEFDNERVYEGAVVPMKIDGGYVVDGKVERIDDEVVVLDFNHPLAGQEVRYVGQVVTVRDATPEEMTPPSHGCGCGCGHDHGNEQGCGCDGCSGCQ